MAKIAIFYGSTTGTCEDIANRIASRLDGATVINASDLTADNVMAYDVLLLGSSTWGAGDMQDDWFSAADTLRTLNLSGKRVALFAVGDSAGFGSTFCGALAGLYDAVKATGAELIGRVSREGYEFDDSEGLIDGQFVGLPLDESNEPDKTDARIDAWIASLAL